MDLCEWTCICDVCCVTRLLIHLWLKLIMSSNLRVGMQTQMPGGRSTARDAAVKWAITYISRHLIICLYG